MFSCDTIVIDHVPEPIDRGEVLRYLGYPAGVLPSPHIIGTIDRWIEAAVPLADPKALFRILPIANKTRRTMRVQCDGIVTEFHGAIGEFLHAATAVAVFIATAGAALEQRASELMDCDEPLGALVLNAIGAERAEAAETVVAERLRATTNGLGMAPTLPYSPGYCGMPLTEQHKLFQLLDHPSIGVALTADCLMVPLKSISGLIGLGPATQVVHEGTPCERCELRHCSMRR